MIKLYCEFKHYVIIHLNNTLKAILIDILLNQTINFTRMLESSDKIRLTILNCDIIKFLKSFFLYFVIFSLSLSLCPPSSLSLSLSIMQTHEQDFD